MCWQRALHVHGAVTLIRHFPKIFLSSAQLSLVISGERHYQPAQQGCGVGVRVARSRIFLGGFGVGFLRTPGVGVGVGFFIWLQKFNWIIFSIALLNLEYLLVPVEMVQILLKLLLKRKILAVYHDFHWLLVATKLLTAKLHTLYVKESESLEKSELESDILPPTPQHWFKCITFLFFR